MKRTILFWITVLVLGWLFDFLFWGHAPGINFASYVVLCLGGGFLVLDLNGFKTSWKALVLLVPILFFASVTFIRQEPLSLFLAFVLTLGSMGLLVVSCLVGSWPVYSLTDYVVQSFRLVGSLLARPILFLSETRQPGVPTAEEAVTHSRSGWKRFWAILRGILIALPVLALFAALLSSADLVFA